MFIVDAKHPEGEDDDHHDRDEDDHQCSHLQFSEIESIISIKDKKFSTYTRTVKA